jgi:hypothetical protein
MSRNTAGDQTTSGHGSAPAPRPRLRGAVTAGERNFWRRAVADERERLGLADCGGLHDCRPDVH